MWNIQPKSKRASENLRVLIPTETRQVADEVTHKPSTAKTALLTQSLSFLYCVLGFFKCFFCLFCRCLILLLPQSDKTAARIKLHLREEALGRQSRLWGGCVWADLEDQQGHRIKGQAVRELVHTSVPWCSHEELRPFSFRKTNNAKENMQVLKM